MTAEAAGFKKFESTANKLDSNSTLSIDAALTVGAATRNSGSGRLGSAAANRVGRGRKAQSPIADRLPGTEWPQSAFLASLQPGVRSSTTWGTSASASPAAAMRSTERGRQDTLMTLDGAPAIARAPTGSIGVADVDSTQEIQVLTADYSAEYGRASRRPDPHHHQKRRQRISTAAPMNISATRI